jgi:hypothetical protein
MQFRKYLIILIVLGLVSCKPISCADFVKKGNRTSSKNKRESFYYNALEADSNCFDAHFGLGWEYANSIDSTTLLKSRTHFQKAISLDSNCDQCWYGLGYTYLSETRDSTMYLPTARNKQLKSVAIEYFNVAISKDSLESLYFLQRGNCYLAIDQDSLANLDFEKSCLLGNSVACMLTNDRK